jgi:GntR family transcriptional regulator/MocR family aminotransferase
VAPDSVIREARALRSLVLRHLPGHTQRTAAYFLALGHHDALIRRLRSAFAERRVAMQGALEKVGLSGAGAPFFAPPSLSGSEAPTNFMRVAYSSITSEKIPEGVGIIADEISQMLK